MEWVDGVKLTDVQAIRDLGALVCVGVSVYETWRKYG